MKTKLSIGGEVIEFDTACLENLQAHLQRSNNIPSDVSILQLLHRYSTRGRIMSVLYSILRRGFITMMMLCAVAYGVYAVKFEIHRALIVRDVLAFMMCSTLVYLIMIISSAIFWGLFVAKYSIWAGCIESALRQIHPEGELLPEYSQDAIELYLNMLANRCIADEQAFDRARLDTGRPVDQILQTGQEYKAARESSNHAIEGFNTTFGMSWSRPKLLRAAQARFNGATPT